MVLRRSYTYSYTCDSSALHTHIAKPAFNNNKVHCLKGDSSTLFFATDFNTGLWFLVDTGAEVSVFPVTADDTSVLKKTAPLQAMNTTAIPAYSRRVHYFDLELRPLFTWAFVLATISPPKLGADVPSYYGLLVNMQHKRFIIRIRTFPSPSIFSTSAPTSSPATILAEFPELTDAVDPTATPSRSITRQVHLQDAELLDLRRYST